MPAKFPRPCAHPGCRKYAQEGRLYCKEHSEQRKRESEASRMRGTRTERGYSNAWLRASKLFLMRHPLCAECARHGIATPATEVDHIIPHRGNMKLFWDRSNWQPLCHECHSRKTAMFDGGFGRAATPREGSKS